MRRAPVISSTTKPLMPCHPARELLRAGNAAVFRWEPLTILKERDNGNTQPLALKLDPGSKTSGVVLVADRNRGKNVLWCMELTHRRQEIRDSLLSRRALRGGRRNRETRYRKPRFINRTRPAGWLPPSLGSRVENLMSWVGKLGRVAPVSCISMELVKVKGRGIRQLCGIDACGFPFRHRSGKNKVCGFQTDDMVEAAVPKGKYRGAHGGSVAVRERGYFDLKAIEGKRIAEGMSHRYIRIIHRSDGYYYRRRGAFLPAMNYREECADLS